MTEPTVHLVENNGFTDPAVSEILRAEGCRVHCECSGEALCSTILNSPPDLVILDTELPDMSGFDVCKRIRTQYDGGILFLTDSREELDQLLAFELGADDFVVRPIHPRVLHARIRALVQRCSAKNGSRAPRVFAMGPFRISRGNREVALRGQRIDLTTHEFDLLWLLASHAGTVVSRNQIYQALYNCDHNGTDRSVDVYVSRIRQKLGDDPSSPVYLKTVRGSGYLFASELSS